MNSLYFSEFELLFDEARSYLGGEVNGFTFSKDCLVIRIFKDYETVNFVFDLSKNKSLFLITHEKLPKLKSEQKPLSLFLKKHLNQKPLTEVECLKEYGRVVRLHFDDVSIEVQLMASVKNIICRVGSSQLSLSKVKELEVVDAGAIEYREPRDLRRAAENWVESLYTKGSSDKKKSSVSSEKVQLEKKISKVKTHIESLTSSRWQEFVTHLEAVPTEPPNEASTHELYDMKLTAVENRQMGYEKIKKQRHKAEQAKLKLAELEKQLYELNSGATKKVTELREEYFLEGADAKARTLQISADLKAYVGKSGKDNLKLLRKAKPWYIWMHIKDYPGAHLIVQRNKGREVSQKELVQAARWGLEQSISKKQVDSIKGGKIAFLYSERRYVSPIKGDRHGRVRCSSPSELYFHY